jgi:hypothetical protein
MKKNQVTSDALVTFADALKWAEPLMQENPSHVIRRVLAIEPAVFGVAANIGRRTCERLEARGLSRAQNAYVFDQICLAAAIAIELMRHGNAKLWSDMIEPSEDDSKENDHE